MLCTAFRTYPLPLTTHILLLIPCCSNYCSLSCLWTSFPSHIFLFSMPVSGYRQIGSSQMFLPEVLLVLYWDKFCIYMPLTLTTTSLPALIFYVFVHHFFWNIPDTARKISVRPKCMFFPNMFPQVYRIPFPYVVCRVTFHQIYDFSDWHCWLCFDHVMDMEAFYMFLYIDVSQMQKSIPFWNAFGLFLSFVFVVN